MQITVSAPGKIHLMGEHSVVYGKPALLTAIDKRLFISIKNQKPSIKARENIIVLSSQKDNLIRKTIEIFKTNQKIYEIPFIEITVTSQIPSGCGLGSSAALAVALSGALMKFLSNIWNPVKINELAYQVEKIQHGSPSGADNSIATFGGLLWYRKEFEFLKSIWSLPTTSYKFPRLFLINSGKPKESTGEMVEAVAKLYQARKKILENLLINQEILTKKILLALKNNDLKEFCLSIRRGEANLEKMGVVGKSAQIIIGEIEKSGGVAKICGAGGRKEGSGMLLCFHDKPEMLFNIAKKRKLEYFPVKLGEEGIRLEQGNNHTSNGETKRKKRSS